MNVLEEIAEGTLGPELEHCPLPETYLAAHLRLEDVEPMQAAAEKDVRDSIHVGELPVPDLAPDEALIAVMASSINYNTVWSALFEPVPTFDFLERLAREGGWATRHRATRHAVGSDAAGIVVRVGAGVRRWSVGDRVVVSPSWVDEQDPASQMDGLLGEHYRAWGFETNFGGLAQLAVAKASQLLPKPRHLTWEEAASNTLCAMTAYRMLVSRNGARMKQGDIVLVWGATGGLGAYAVQLVRNGGGIAVGVVGSVERERALSRLGCDVVLRRDELELGGHDTVADGRLLGGAIRDALGEDPHIAFDYVGRETFATSVYVVRRGGTVVTCGSSSGYRHEYDNRYLWMRLKRIVGSHAANSQEAWEVNRLLTLGRLAPALSRVYPLAQTGEAARSVQLNRHLGKVGVLCLADREGLGIDDPTLRAELGTDWLRPFQETTDRA